MSASGGVLSRGTRSALPTRLVGDQRLAELVATGDDRAFAAIYERYHQPLFRYCRTITQHEQDAQDALQATMTSAFGALRKAALDAPLRPWLFRVAHNEAVTVLRRRKPTSQLTGAEPSVSVPVEETAEVRERLTVLMSDLADLPERQRGALVMRELSGLSHRDIAEAFGVAEPKAKQAILDARMSLAEFERGRSMECDTVRPLISDGDGRKLRGRPVRAHLRACADCRALRDAIHGRQADLALIAPPLAPSMAAALLAKLLGGGGSGGGSGGASILGAKASAAALAGKAIAGTAVVAVVGIGTVDAVRSSPDKHRTPQTATQPVATTAPKTEVIADPAQATPTAGAASSRPASARTISTHAERRQRSNKARTKRKPASAHASPTAGPGVTATPTSQTTGASGADNPHRGGVLAPGRTKNHGLHKGATRGNALGKVKKQSVTPKPVKTPKPAKTPRPVKTPKPVRTPRPAVTPVATTVATPEATATAPASHGKGKGKK